MLRVNHRIAIPQSEFQFEFARSGGPGGQNVNKVASKAILRWNPAESPSLPEPVRERLLRTLGRRLTNEGELLVSSQRTRDQNRNIDDCLEKVRRLVLAAAEPPRPRKPTKPTLGSRLRRAKEKTRRSELKQQRRKPTLD